MSVQPITEGLTSPAMADEVLEGVEKADGVELKSARVSFIEDNMPMQ